jgi:hypothetical protein
MIIVRTEHVCFVLLLGLTIMLSISLYRLDKKEKYTYAPLGLDKKLYCQIQCQQLPSNAQKECVDRC